MKTERVKEFPMKDQLFNDYIEAFDKVSDFFTFDPKEEESFQRRMETMVPKPFEQRKELVASLTAYNRSLGCSHKVLRNIKKLKEKDTFAVVTGQQAGIFAGPLYSIYKAAAVISLSKHIENETGKTVVPIFWVASEDHDFQEVSSVFVPGKSTKTEKISVLKPYANNISVGNLPLPKDIDDAIENYEKLTLEDKYKEKWMEIIKSAAYGSGSLADWFARLMSALFSKYGLIFFDSMDQHGRDFSKSIFLAALQNHDEINHVLTDNKHELTAKKYTPQLEWDSQTLPFFLNTPEGRFSLVKEDDHTYTANDPSKTCFSKEDIESEIDKKPGRFSPNVLLRPMVQDHILPTVAYAAGPGEIAYYAQLKNIYPVFQQEMPVIFPRLSATIIDEDMTEALNIFDLSIEELFYDHDDHLKNYLHSKEPFSIEKRFDEIKQIFENYYNHLGNDLVEIDEDLKTLSEENFGRIRHQIEYLENKTKQKHRRNEKKAVQLYENLKENLLPKGNPQERMFTVFPYLFRLDQAFLDAVTDIQPDQYFQHIALLVGDDKN